MSSAVAPAPLNTSNNYPHGAAGMGLEASAANLQTNMQTGFSMPHQLQQLQHQQQGQGPSAAAAGLVHQSFTALLLQGDPMGDLLQQEPCMPAAAPTYQQQQPQGSAAAAPAALTVVPPVVCTLPGTVAAPAAALVGDTVCPFEVKLDSPPPLLLQGSNGLGAVLLQEQHQFSMQQLQFANGFSAAAAAGWQQQQQPLQVKPADADVCTAVKGRDDQLQQHACPKQQPLLLHGRQQAQEQTAATFVQPDSKDAAAAAGAGAEGLAGQGGSSINPDGTVILLQQQAAQTAAAEAEAAAVAAAASREQQQRITDAPLHKRAFEALVAAAAAEADATEGEPPGTKRQRQGGGSGSLPPAVGGGAAGAAAEAGPGGRAAEDAEVAAAAAAAAAGYGQSLGEEGSGEVTKGGRLAEAVAAALAAAAAAAGQVSSSAQAAAAAAGAYGDEASTPTGHAPDQYGFAEGGGYGGAAGWGGGPWGGAPDGSWDGSEFAGDTAGSSMQGGEGAGSGQGRSSGGGDPQRAMKKRLAASESYKRKKEQEAQLNTYWTGLQGEARLLRQAIDAADAELAAHAELQAGGDAHAPGRQLLLGVLQPEQPAPAGHTRQRRR